MIGSMDEFNNPAWQRILERLSHEAEEANQAPDTREYLVLELPESSLWEEEEEDRLYPECN